MQFPDYEMKPNLYGECSGPASKSDLAWAFKKNGWAMRKCAWDDYEVESDFADLVIEGKNNDNLISGCFLDSQKNISKISSILDSLGRTWSFEKYDTEGNEIRKFTNEGCS